MNKYVKFKVIKDIYWDDWGYYRKVFCKGDVCKGILHSNGTVSAESPYYKGISDCIDSKCIKIL